jgi:hypothetical protein
MPRYVILEHDHPKLHWDFMLETGAALRTWRLAAPPQAGKVIAATLLGEHRLAYLDYEGPLSGNRGSVKQWDRGDFEETAARDDFVEVRLHGRRLCGTVRLISVDATGAWQFQLAEPVQGPSDRAEA